MSQKKAKKYSKKKEQPNQPGPGFNTSSNFRKSVFGGSKFGGQNVRGKSFNPSTFKTQHKG